MPARHEKYLNRYRLRMEERTLRGEWDEEDIEGVRRRVVEREETGGRG